MITAIVIVDKNWGIGYKGDLLLSIPDDMKRFREKTEGAYVIMGRKTFESLPGRKPLKNRVNIVLTSDMGYEQKHAGIMVFHSVSTVLSYLNRASCGYEAERNIFIIGGGSVYQQFLPYCDTAFVTRIDRVYEADVFFPNLQKAPGWTLSHTEANEYNNMSYYYEEYVNEQCDMRRGC